MSGRHMTDDEIVNRVFPVEEGPAPIPIHQAVCPECQQRVARLREGFLLDRGAVTGVVESIPEEVWAAQRRSVMGRIADLAARDAGDRVTPFPERFTRSILRRPALAVGSLAAALALVAGMTVLRGGADPKPAAAGTTVSASVAADAPVLPPADQADDDLLRDVDSVLSNATPLEALLPEQMR